MTEKDKLQAADQAAFLFMATEPAAINAAEEGKRRKFEGVGYSGQMIENHWWWGNVIFDLDTMTVPKPLAILLDHDSGQRVAVATDNSISNERGLVLSGQMMTNDTAKSVAQDSDDGFPWQMSVHISPSAIEYVESGEKMVNGHMYRAPFVILKNSTIREVSFCSVGQDANTTARAFSLRNTNQTTTAKAFSKGEHQEGDPMDLQMAQARITELEGQLTAVTAERDKFSKAARTEQIKNLFSVIGREYKDDDADVLAFAALPDVGFAATDKMLREQFSKQPTTTKPTVPAHLFSHQANCGTEPVAGLDGAFAKMINGMKEGK